MATKIAKNQKKKLLHGKKVLEFGLFQSKSAKDFNERFSK